MHFMVFLCSKKQRELVILGHFVKESIIHHFYYMFNIVRSSLHHNKCFRDNGFSGYFIKKKYFMIKTTFYYRCRRHRRLLRAGNAPDLLFFSSSHLHAFTHLLTKRNNCTIFLCFYFSLTINISVGN